MARLRASWRTSLPVVQQPRNPQSESIARSPYDVGGHGDGGPSLSLNDVGGFGGGLLNKVDARDLRPLTCERGRGCLAVAPTGPGRPGAEDNSGLALQTIDHEFLSALQVSLSFTAAVDGVDDRPW